MFFEVRSEVPSRVYLHCEHSIDKHGFPIQIKGHARVEGPTGSGTFSPDQRFEAPTIQEAAWLFVNRVLTEPNGTFDISMFEGTGAVHCDEYVDHVSTRPDEDGDSIIFTFQVVLFPPDFEGEIPQCDDRRPVAAFGEFDITVVASKDQTSPALNRSSSYPVVQPL